MQSTRGLGLRWLSWPESAAHSDSCREGCGMRGRKPELATDRNALDAVIGAPAWLSKHAKAEWRRVMPDLTKRRILTAADLGSLESYCIATSQVRDMERLIAKEGHVV